jgi:hypothetical protein
MKNLELCNYGVVEMNNDEMRKVDGGIWLIILGALIWYETQSAWQAGQDDKNN